MRSVRRNMSRGLLLLAGLSATAAWAAATPLALDARAPAGDIGRQVAEIRRELADGKTYAEIGSADRAQVEQALERVSGVVESASGPELSQAERVSLGHDETLVNTILTRAREDSRLVCKRERSVGSNMLASHCMTVAQRRATQRSSQNEMGELQRNKSSADN